MKKLLAKGFLLLVLAAALLLDWYPGNPIQGVITAALIFISVLFWSLSTLLERDKND